MDDTQVVIPGETGAPARKGSESDMISCEDHRRIERGTTVVVQILQEPVAACDESSAAVVGFQAEIGQIPHRRWVAIHEGRRDRASAQTDNLSSPAIAPNSDLKIISPNVAGVEETGLAFEGYANRTRNSIAPQQLPKFEVIGRSREVDIELRFR